MTPAIIAIIAAVAYMVARSRGSSPPVPQNTTAEAAQLIAEARKEKGKPYSQDNDPPQGSGHWDCSGLIQGVHARLGMGLPRQITEQAQNAPIQRDPKNAGSVDEMKSMLQPGDCIGTGVQANGRYKHGGIWTGNSVVHASSSRGSVVEDMGLSAYWYNERRRIYRYVP